MPLPTAVPRVTRLLRRLGAGAALLAAAAGCGGDATGPNADVAGRYDIVRVNDDTTAPFTVVQQTSNGTTFALELVSGSFTLDDDGRYTSRATTRFVINGQSQGDDVSPEQNGRYTVSGSTVTFDPAGNDPDEPNFTATRDGDSLTISETETDPDTGRAVTLTIVLRR